MSDPELSKLNGQMQKTFSALGFALVVLLAHVQCRQSSQPLAPEGAAVALRLSFRGHALNFPAELGKARQALAKTLQVNRIVVRVFAGEEGAVLDSAIINLTSEQQTFRADLTVPTGPGRVVEADAFEDRSGDGKGENPISVLSWRGRKGGITVLRSDTVRVAVDLFPTPILGERVVLEVSDATGTRNTSGNAVAIALANLDVLRGLQFDLLYNNDILQPEQFNRLGRIANFNSIRAAIVPGQVQGRSIYRVVIFDQSNPLGEIGLVARIEAPEKIADVLFRVAAANAATDTLKLVSGVATTATLLNLQVYVKDDGVFTVR